MNYLSKSSAFEDGKMVRACLNNPKGWKIRVFENLGWHVNLVKGGMSLYWDCYNKGPRTFSTLFDSSGHGPGGEMYWSDHFHSINPNTALEHQLKLAKNFVKQCTKAIQEVIL
jgi:hypothetical protein